MKFSIGTLGNVDLNGESLALSNGADDYLTNCDEDVYRNWKSRFPSEKSLAKTLSKAVFPKLESMGHILGEDITRGVNIVYGFKHRSYSPQIFFAIFRKYKRELKRQTGFKDFLLITQSQRFKEKFLYDSSTMTISSLRKDFEEFIDVLEIAKVPRIFTLALDDVDVKATTYLLAGKKYLHLTKCQT